MDCEEIAFQLGALVDGEVSPQEEGVIRGHLGQCSGCARELNELEALAGLSTVLSAPEVPRQEWNHRWQNIRLQLSEEQGSLIRPREGYSNRYALSGAVMAGLLATFLLLAPKQDPGSPVVDTPHDSTAAALSATPQDSPAAMKHELEAAAVAGAVSSQPISIERGFSPVTSFFSTGLNVGNASTRAESDSCTPIPRVAPPKLDDEWKPVFW